MYVATAVLMVACVQQVLLAWLINRHVERLYWISMIAAIMFGGLTLALRDPVFIQWQPTIVNGAMAALFAGSRYVGDSPLTKRMMSGSIDLPEPVWVRLNGFWVIFFALCAGANILVAKNFSEPTWVNFKLFGLSGMSLVFVFFQVLYLRSVLDIADEEP
jgi:intracellular septation protein